MIKLKHVLRHLKCSCGSSLNSYMVCGWELSFRRLAMGMPTKTLDTTELGNHRCSKTINFWEEYWHRFIQVEVSVYFFSLKIRLHSLHSCRGRLVPRQGWRQTFIKLYLIRWVSILFIICLILKHFYKTWRGRVRFYYFTTLTTSCCSYSNTTMEFLLFLLLRVILLLRLMTIILLCLIKLLWYLGIHVGISCEPIRPRRWCSDVRSISCGSGSAILSAEWHKPPHLWLVKLTSWFCLYV